MGEGSDELSVVLTIDWISGPPMVLAIAMGLISRHTFGDLNRVISDGSNAAAAYLLFFMLVITALPVFGVSVTISIDDMIQRDRVLMVLAFFHSALACTGNVTTVLSKAFGLNGSATEAVQQVEKTK